MKVSWESNVAIVSWHWLLVGDVRCTAAVEQMVGDHVADDLMIHHSSRLKAVSQFDCSVPPCS